MAKIIIVGAGVAGLTAGIYALSEGHKVSVYERHFKAGGNLTGWDRQGYHIDNCIHWLTGTNQVTEFYKMWVKLGALGEGIEVHQPDSLYTYEKDGKTLSLDKSLTKLQADMLAIAPEDKKETMGLIRAIRSVQRLNGMGGMDCERKSNAWENLVSVPDLIKYGKYTIKQLSERFQNPLLRSFLHSFMPEHFNVLAMIMVFATFTGKNGGIPYGASCAMADRMVARFESLGGELHLKNGVAKVNVQDGMAKSVLLDDGSEVQADYVVITADPAVAFGSLLDRSYMPKKLAEQYEDANMIRFACQQCAFSFDGENPPFVGEMVYDVPEQYKEILCSDYLMLREFSHEKSFAPEGKSLLQSMAYCLEDDANALVALYRDKDAYKQRKAQMVEAVEQIICAHLPQLKGKITCIDSWTPATYERFVGSEVGSFMSFIMPAGAAPVQLSGKIEGLDNVVLATQWQMAPGGLPIAAMAGVGAVKLIEKAEKKKR
jgi:phytoene dehydrogenase-like protein